ncbi:tRNA (adenine(37)-N6)-methyltransferase isoform X1 [Schistocerca nitens]|uniref:tRNA (adenine(37)-N6)-methyltransferase isoform X1 n=1 Tax=Schistocerca nitens TaxID=7011 RepID=UPI0021193595|nr:tRNA (adenine(37)-N6)-methyltransferase isoform X1 [Schistocerca nitens]
MASCVEREDDISCLRQQLTVARNEINNLRQQIRSLSILQRKEVDNIHNVLETWQCSGCREATSQSNVPDDSLTLHPIGTISTWFPAKRGTPRQPGICASSRGKLTLSNTVFTNPEHALEGLEEFSHMWILFHFHKNDSTHIRAKVSPPRLNGARLGVFGTRSPHRPCPVGLSLVCIDRVEGSSVYFSGVDMVDGTPVLDIKPYIPQYDCPLESVPGSTELRLMDGLKFSREKNVDAAVERQRQVLVRRSMEVLVKVYGRTMELLCYSVLIASGTIVIITRTGCESEADTSLMVPEGAADSISVVFPSHTERMVAEGVTAPAPTARMGEREAPDGEEETADSSQSAGRMAARDVVRVPQWVTHSPTPELNVAFSERARAQLESLAAETGSDGTGATAETIAAVLREDPRSVYLRRRWGSQFYTFLIADLHVSCKFDDSAHTVNVFQVRPAGKMCECGHLEWQCSLHGTTSE